MNEISNFETRRINLTFRYVPDEHILPFHKMSLAAQEDTRPYMKMLARHSAHFRSALDEVSGQ